MDDASLETLPRFSWAEIKKNLSAQTPFEAITPMGTALIRVLRYEPIIGLTVHSGHHVREELATRMAMEPEERRLEEDPGSDRLIAAYPIQMIALDSRYEYDLDRTRNDSVYIKPFQSYGKKVWQTPPSKDELEMSYQKWDEFHELFDYLIGEFTKRMGKVCVVDAHAYNSRRSTFVGKKQALPLFCIAYSEADAKTHKAALDAIRARFNTFKTSAEPTLVAENSPFKKEGALVKALSVTYPDSLFLPVEVKSVFFDPESATLNEDFIKPFAAVFEAIGRDLLAIYKNK